MDIVANLMLGFETALTLQNLGYCLFGAFVGTAIGVLPGLGPTATISMLLPATFALEPVSALIMLAGIFYGAQYGGSTTAILIKLPGEVSSIVTVIDGHRMASQGRAGAALAAAALASFTAGTIATFVIAVFAPPLALVAIEFGPAEYVSLMVLGLIASVVLASGPLLNAVGMVLLGLLLGMVGTDVNSGVHRFTLGFPQLASGLDFVVVAMGMFGLGEIVANLRTEASRDLVIARVTNLVPRLSDLKRIVAPTLRGTVLGSALGILPGGGAALASFSAYAIEKKVSRHRAELGNGAIEGVAAPEAANNAASQTSFIPMLTLGVPSNPVMALMIGALLIQGVQPGPSVMTLQPALFWGLVASMWIGNCMLVILNLPLIGFWVRMISIPYHLLFPIILMFCAIGVFSLDNATFDIHVMALFGVVGYLFKRLDCEPAPLLLGFILGPMLEEYFRRAMLFSAGDPTTFLRHPISAALLAVALLFALIAWIPTVRRTRREAIASD